MKFARKLANVLLLSVLGVSSSLAAENTPSMQDSTPYQEVLTCGPNSLFMFLRLLGNASVTSTYLRERTVVSSNGVSLLQLKDEAAELGVATEIRRYAPSEAASIPVPAIAQLETGKNGLTKYHFGVIYKIDSKRMYLIDGTTADKLYIDLSPDMTLWFSGVAMTAQRRFWTADLLYKNGFMVGSICLVVINSLLFMRRLAERNPMSPASGKQLLKGRD